MDSSSENSENEGHKENDTTSKDTEEDPEKQFYEISIIMAVLFNLYKKLSFLNFFLLSFCLLENE